MSYGGELVAAPINFPKAKKLKGPKAKKPCAYGDRLANGRCPKKPRAPKAQRMKATAIDKAIAKGLNLPKSTTRSSTRTSPTEKVAVAAGGRIAQLGARRIAGKLSGETLSSFLSGAIFSGGAKMVAARLSLVAAAGIAAYSITTAILNSIKDRRERLQRQKDSLADAYRQTRLDLAASQGSPLTPLQLSQVSRAFQDKAREIGWTWPGMGT